ncbi:Arm DNA-binding domain-containing protein [Mucilaginibacter endophyticus]|uniref:Arm DNA-binding domain-containing protein n=1 Tax=Mucilaginibacter endophyticus TaxID=2675003 RepID=UPI000E0DDE50|nr:Arm DNA-binding domain-containing protein [Mucilaginibacter endophyticus]
MRTNVNLLFYLKKPKNYQSGPIPVYLRFTVDGKRSEATTGRTCEPSRWNNKAGRLTGTKEDVRALNNYLDGLQSQMPVMPRSVITFDNCYFSLLS